MNCNCIGYCDVDVLPACIVVSKFRDQKQKYKIFLEQLFLRLAEAIIAALQIIHGYFHQLVWLSQFRVCSLNAWH